MTRSTSPAPSASSSATTQITDDDAGVDAHRGPLGAVTPKTAIPGTDCALPGTACLDGAALDTAREAVEGEAVPADSRLDR